MEFSTLEQKALFVRKLFEHFEVEKYGRSWTREELALGFVGDLGDLMKLLIAENNVRDIPDRRQKLAHELSDCLWSIIVLSKLYDVDLQKAFLDTMSDLESRLQEQITKQE